MPPCDPSSVPEHDDLETAHSAGLTVISCDESGNEGAKVFGSQSRVFSHGAVCIELDRAQELVNELRGRLRIQPNSPEIKAKDILKTAARPDLLWFFADDGPIAGLASAWVIDKEFFVTSKVIDILYESLAHEMGIDLYSGRKAREVAYQFHRYGPRSFDREDWDRLVEAFNSLARIKQRKGVKVSVDEFFQILKDLVNRCRLEPMREILFVLINARKHADELVAHFVEDPDQIPTIDPLFAGLPATARFWHDRYGRPVQIIHDRQTTLTPSRVEQLMLFASVSHPEFLSFAPRFQIVGIEQVDSKSDPRVQLADLVSGVSRRMAEEILFPDEFEQTNLPIGAIRKFILQDSVTGSQRDWRRLMG